jgi:hypothetical protein
MTFNRHPADELADVRAEIKRLECREADRSASRRSYLGRAHRYDWQPAA